ncbi:IclR family transcriptional regulator [Qaidamihabitans albus]|uniref:IclR family transcriptional regulator n=1 Tax=Qaidamihabitans albus TaxID=2795733 RepID=UPI0018F211BE|nr:IclR family transcriptional regulator [Qaidamihabitans albus]
MTTTTAEPPTDSLAPAGRTAAGRVLAVLGAFDYQHRLLSLSEIARRGELTLPTAHRLVAELVSFGALERGHDGRYGVGLRLLELSALAPRGLQLREIAFPFLSHLHRTTGGNVHLGVRDGSEVVYVDTMRSRLRHPITSRVGDRWPLHATGTGLVLLAHAGQDVQDEVLSAPLERFTPKTVVDPGELRRILTQIRRTGVAVAHGQITLPNTVVAVPVLAISGEVTAAISVVVESERARPRELEIALREVSRAISRSLKAANGVHTG